VISANDESFMVWKTGRYYRVPVLHVVEFDGNNRIRRFINIHDTPTAEQAFSGADTGLVAIMPKDEPKAPPRRLTEEAAMELANGIVSVIFGDCAATALQRFPHLCLYVPGLPSVAAISGVWTGPGLSTNYPAQAERFRKKYGIAVTQVLIDDVTVSEGKLAIEGRLRDQRWAIVGSIHEVGLGATALFIDFPAL
jgi:hypothetical protein